jgi:Flp pilus assembly protein TadG
MSTPTNRGWRRARDERGTAIAELALVLPILLVVLLGTLDAGKAFNYWIDSTHLANEAARYAAVHKSPVSSGSCSSYGPNPPCQTLEAAIKSQGTTQQLKDAITVCVKTTGTVGDPVEVKVSSTYNWLQFLIGKGFGPTSTIQGKATMRVEVAHNATVPVYTKAASCP